MSVRSRVRNILVGAAAALGAAGIIVVSQPPSPKNVGLDCNESRCIALLDPPAGQCAALLSRVDPGGAPGRVLRTLEGLRESDALGAWVALVRPDDPTRCFVEVRLSLSRIELPDGGVRLDGQAPAWRDVVDAAGVGSIVVDGKVSRRPAWARADVDGGPCRSHVFLGEDPCAPSDDVQDTTDEDGGTP